ncbi:MAG TPA: MFS transporter [Spirochaetia bacterium]|nr:MFS transporter [Spirochaetia bacterium]
MADAAEKDTTAEVVLDTKKTIPWIIFIIFFAVLNETVFNVSTPVIAKQFNLSASGVSWVMTTFVIFFGVGSVIYGKLSDIFSPKSLILFGISLYSAGSLLGFVFQSSYAVVIAARAIQGAGASAIPALVMVVVARYIPSQERGRVFGVITSTVAFGIGVGPIIGGFVSGALHWSFLFAVPLFTLISIPAFRRVLPGEERRPGKVDVPGALLVAGGVGSLMLFLTFDKWYYLVASITLLTGFIVDVLVSPNPFIDVALLRNSVFRKRVYVGFIIFSVVTGVLFVVPLMLTSVRGMSTSSIGLILFPGAIISALLGTYGGNLADKRGNAFVITIGLSLLVASFLLLSFAIGGAAILIAGTLVLMYVGFNFTQTALINSVSQTLDESDTGIGMGLFNLVSFISAAVGTSLVGRYLEGGWLDFWHSPLIADSRAFPYSNLLIVFALLVLAGAGVYYRSNRNASQT